LKDGPLKSGFVLAEQKNLPRMKLGFNREANSAKCATITTNYHRAIVVEDAVSGVQAGFKGNFGLVIGVARENNAHELKANGADVVVEDLSEVTVDKINQLIQSRQAER
jgi:beta-phosphoglucomutase-like phosphatase (HAD superfamily)